MNTAIPTATDSPKPIRTRRLRQTSPHTPEAGSTECSTGNVGTDDGTAVAVQTQAPEPTHFITLQSHEAQKLWLGRAPTGSNTYRILGCVDFSGYVRQITTVAREHNDPYAIFQLIKIERALSDLKQGLTDRLHTLKDLLNEDEDTGMDFNAPSLKSFNAQKFPVLFASGYGYSAARAVGRFDRVIVLSVTARNCALLTEEDWNRSVPDTARKFRAFFELARGFRFSGASIDDFASNNSRARQAVEKYGKPLDDVLQGKLRPSLLTLPRPATS